MLFIISIQILILVCIHVFIPQATSSCYPSVVTTNAALCQMYQPLLLEIMRDESQGGLS